MNSKEKNKNDEIIPLKFHLSQNYPNPFKEKTTIKYCVAYKTKVRITIYNSEGAMIRNLVDEVKEAGTYETEFYPVFYSQLITPGTYLYRMKAGEYLSEKEMILLKEKNINVQSK